jgi:polysaccharide deacetylase family protein (PEP-CTERM system associated)
MSFPKDPIYNAFSVDVEDYYMVSGFADVVMTDNWHTYESRVEKNTYRILDLMDEHCVKGTFFVLGWIAERWPSLTKEIHVRGHEVASHGYNHRLVYDQTVQDFRTDINRTKKILEDITGHPVIGFRAASYSITKKSSWALDILVEEGYKYDSSIFPIHHDRYGMPDALRFPHVLETENGKLIEFPPSTYTLMGQNIPVCGGGYLRFLPLGIIKMAIRKINKKERQSAVIYIHPWEADVDQPRLKGRLSSNIRHYLNLKSTMPKITALMKEFKFKPFSSLLDAVN